MDSPGTFVIFNPHAGRGRGSRVISAVLDSLDGHGRMEHALTTRPGEEERLAEDAVNGGHRRVVAVGGDGTWSRVANGLLRANASRPAHERAELGLVAGGTGCDLAKSLGIPREVLGATAVIRKGYTRAIDAGRIEGRYFINIAGFGYDIAVLEDSWNVKYLEGELLYLYCAIRQLRSFAGFRVSIEADGVALGERDLLMLILANARVFGGGFMIAPEADLSDGQLEAVAFTNMSVLRRVGIMAQLLRGTHGHSPLVSRTRTRTLRLRFQGAPPAYEMDGEWNRAASSEIVVETVPDALRVLVPAP